MSFSPTSYHFLLTIILTLLLPLTSPKYTILSSPIQVAFDEYSAIKQLTIRFMPEASFFRNDFMMLSFS